MKPKANRTDGDGIHFMRVVALGRFVYGVILLGLGLTIFNSIGENLSAELLGLIHRWRIDSHLYYVHWLLEQVSHVSAGLLVVLAVANFSYAGLAFAEAAGLIFGRRWAYWLVIADTASFIPIETYQVVKKFGWINFILLLYYFATVVYFVWELKRLPRQKI